MSQSERASIITDLLLAAAHADGTLDGREALKVKELVGALTTDPMVLSRAERRLREFAPGDFDLARAAAAFAQDSEEQKRHLLELVAQVHDADDELDLAEDGFLRSLGEALGLSADSFGDLSLDYSVEEQQEQFEDLLEVDVD